mmetsp:Transcript_25036/g.57637  ORF Transcript_25036/g.57637 Transcript_25036/m.57637 type:complete len:403 (+) Transcript_25036:1048-2256(+)
MTPLPDVLRSACASKCNPASRSCSDWSRPLSPCTDHVSSANCTTESEDPSKPSFKPTSTSSSSSTGVGSSATITSSSCITGAGTSSFVSSSFVSVHDPSRLGPDFLDDGVSDNICRLRATSRDGVPADFGVAGTPTDVPDSTAAGFVDDAFMMASETVAGGSGRGVGGSESNAAAIRRACSCRRKGGGLAPQSASSTSFSTFRTFSWHTASAASGPLPRAKKKHPSSAHTHAASAASAKVSRREAGGESGPVATVTANVPSSVAAAEAARLSPTHAMATAWSRSHTMRDSTDSCNRSGASPSALVTARQRENCEESSMTVAIARSLSKFCASVVARAFTLRITSSAASNRPPPAAERTKIVIRSSGRRRRLVEAVCALLQLLQLWSLGQSRLAARSTSCDTS